MSDSIRAIQTKDAATPAGPYSQAIHTGSLIFVSGQIPASPSDGSLVSGSIAEKTAACLRSVEAILREAGSSLAKVVKVNVFLTDMAHFAEMNGEYEKWFVGDRRPARSCVAVLQLPKGVEVEVECVAVA